jgi:hypothetical protein
MLFFLPKEAFSWYTSVEQSRDKSRLYEIVEYVDNLWITQPNIQSVLLKMINQNAAFVDRLFRKCTF